jgi:uncharacterized protein (DUF2062 family)
VLSNIRSRLDRLSTTEGSARRTAAALALGVFLSFSPFLGLQIVIGLAAAFALRLSRVAVLLGLCANLPWIMLPWYALTTAGAATVIGTPPDVNISERLGALLSVPVYHPTFWGETSKLITAFFWPFVFGPTLGAGGMAIAAYVTSLRLLERRAARKQGAAAPDSPGPPRHDEERAGDRQGHDPQRAPFQS